MSTAQPRSSEWADPDPHSINALIEKSARGGWRTALKDLGVAHPFFVQRMQNVGLGNWHMLLNLSRESAALDVGCGFGSLALGLGEYYRTVVGIDAIPSRVAYAALRAREDGRSGNAFARASGLALPFRPGSFELVTLNGVLEWAGLHASGDPRRLQVEMLSDARRVLSESGTLAVAIENRFAMETLVGMPDTHTGVRFVPAIPRRLADRVMRSMRSQPFRTYLYTSAGHRRLTRDAGFARLRALDLVSSYNDYDFVVDTEDALTYRFLWSRDLVRSFHRRAEAARRAIAKVRPSALGRFGYAYLLLAGRNPRTLLDATHPFWEAAKSRGIDAGLARFAYKGSSAGTMLVVTHDGRRPRWIIEVGIESPVIPMAQALSGQIVDSLNLRTETGPDWRHGGVEFRAHRAI